MDEPIISRLVDGRILRRTSESWSLLNNGNWEPTTDITAAKVIEGRRLTEKEIRDLTAKGVLPR